MAACDQPPRTQPPARRWPPGPTPIVLVIAGRMAPDQVLALCDRVRALLERSGADVVVCDVGALPDPDAGTVDAVARLQLTARRSGRQLCLRDASCELVDLLALVGLGDVVVVERGLRESQGQAEEREQLRGVQERGHPDDPPS